MWAASLCRSLPQQPPRDNCKDLPPILRWLTFNFLTSPTKFGVSDSKFPKNFHRRKIKKSRFSLQVNFFPKRGLVGARCPPLRAHPWRLPTQHSTARSTQQPTE